MKGRRVDGPPPVRATNADVRALQRAPRADRAVAARPVPAAGGTVQRSRKAARKAREPRRRQ